MKNFSTFGAPLFETNHLNQSRNNQIKFNKPKPSQMQFEDHFFKKQHNLVTAINPIQLNNANPESSRANRILNHNIKDEESTAAIAINARNIIKKQKLLIHEPTEKYESELERVFKVRENFILK